MDAFEVLAQQINEKIEQLRDGISNGNAQSFEEYKKTCGEIRGLLTARQYVLDLKQRMENSNE
jgi:hypothetical protein